MRLGPDRDNLPRSNIRGCVTRRIRCAHNSKSRNARSPGALEHFHGALEKTRIRIRILVEIRRATVARRTQYPPRRSNSRWRHVPGLSAIVLRTVASHCVERLAGKTKHQVDTDISETGLAEDSVGNLSLGCVMFSSEQL